MAKIHIRNRPSELLFERAGFEPVSVPVRDYQSLGVPSGLREMWRPEAGDPTSFPNDVGALRFALAGNHRRMTHVR